MTVTGKGRHSGLGVVVLISAVLFCVMFAACESGAKTADLAGQWYTSSPSELRKQLTGYLDNAVLPDIDGVPLGFISPHAGYAYSGPVAAYTYKAAAALDPRVVVIVGFSHRRIMPGIAVFMEKEFVTPLGPAAVDLELSRAIKGHDERIKEFPGAFESEQSVEMEIPFVQVAMKDAKIVLVSIGDQTIENTRILADALYAALKGRDDFVMVASTDMCHYLPYYQAVSRDGLTIKTIEEFDPETLFKTSLENRHELMCGYGATTAVMMAAGKLGADKAVVLKYANSGDTSGMKDKVVGYLSAAFVKTAKGEEEDMLNREQKSTLLKIARDSINSYLATGKTPDIRSDDETLNSEMGAFVTLHKTGRLRGCIGNMVGRGPLYLTVRDMAIAAASQDPRFPPVTADEMDRIDIEISVLSPMEKIDDYNIIEMGKHGVMVRDGWRSGVYLPQVATETGWDRDQFMSSLCSQKAGIQPDAWKTGRCDIYVFTALVFGEKEDE